jgi:hypothetical protein
VLFAKQMADFFEKLLLTDKIAVVGQGFGHCLIWPLVILTA